MLFPLCPIPPNETVACRTHILIVTKPRNFLKYSNKVVMVSKTIKNQKLEIRMKKISNNKPKDYSVTENYR